jgi:soluble lytic murein transglycosylase-like protein
MKPRIRLEITFVIQFMAILVIALVIAGNANFQPKVLDLSRKFRPLVSKVAKEVLLDSNLISAVITQESSWQQFARSPKGALGLMQLMPETAKNWGIKNPFDAEENIWAGSNHLKYLLTLFDGDISLALAAYHAGEKRILKDRAIPQIKETQDYVKAVRLTYAELIKEGLRR